LRERGISLIVSAYQSGRLISIGTDAEGNLRLSSIGLNRSMGLATDPTGLWVATFDAIWRFGHLCGSAIVDRPHDVVFVPQASFHTGYVNAHDLAIVSQRQPIFAASMFNCVATTTLGASLVPIWYPSFVSDRSPRDICHVNGISIENTKLKYVSVFTRMGEPDAWRANVSDGAVIEANSGEPIATELAQPHSPRLHGGRLWLHQSGKGAFGYVEGGKHREVLQCPGYLRGLAFDAEMACIGLSKVRQTASPGSAAFASLLSERRLDAACGILFFDLKTGKVVHDLRFGEGVEEIYDIAVLKFCNPHLIAPNSPEAARAYIIGQPSA